MSVSSAVSRAARVVLLKGPAAVRNLVYARLGIWPVSPLAGADLQSIPVYCISLTRAVAKRRLMERQARGLGFERFEFIAAADARSLDRGKLLADGVIDDAATQRYHSRTLTMNEIACSLSHRLAYQTIVAREHPLALILEDDALFISRRCRALRLSDIPADFDCIFLNTFLDADRPRGRIAGNLYSDASYNGSAAAYIVSAAGARKLLRCSSPVIHAADGLLGRGMKPVQGEQHAFRGQGVDAELACYIVFPDCVLNGSVSYYHVSEVQETRRSKRSEVAAPT